MANFSVAVTFREDVLRRRRAKWRIIIRHLSPRSAIDLPVVGVGSPISCCDKIRINSCGGPAMNVTLPWLAFLRVLLGQSRAMDGTQAGNIGLSMIALRDQRKATNHQRKGCTFSECRLFFCVISPWRLRGGQEKPALACGCAGQSMVAMSGADGAQVAANSAAPNKSSRNEGVRRWGDAAQGRRRSSPGHLGADGA
jgi:hypothetical protein